MSWKKQEIKTPLAEETAQAVTNIAEVTGNLATIFGTITAALQAVKAFIQNSVDPIQNIINAILTEIENTINNLFNTGVYFLVVNPFEINNSAALQTIAEERLRLSQEEDQAEEQLRQEERDLQIRLYNAAPAEAAQIRQELVSIEERRQLKKASINNQRAQLELDRAAYGFDSIGMPLLTPRDAILKAVESFDDTGDSQRPVFSDSGYVSAVGFLVTAPTVDEFITLIESFQSVFNISEFQFILEKTRELRGVNVPEPSVVPDWKSRTLASFEPLSQIRDGLISVVQMFNGFRINADGSLQDLINIMQARTDRLTEITDNLNDLINALNTTTGVYALSIPLGIGGVNRLKQELRDQYLECQTTKYTAMVMIVGGGASTGGSGELVDKLRSLMLGN